MPVRALDFFAKENSAFQTHPLPALSGLRIGVEAAQFIRRITAKIKEPYNAIGTALQFEHLFEQELKLFIDADIQLFFVFAGLNNFQIRKFSFEDERPALRANAWKTYGEGKIENAMSMWNSAGTVPQNEVIPLAMEILHRNGVEFMRAPYSASAQLAFMDSSPFGYFHAVYASNDYLIFTQTERVITDINFETKQFSMIDKVLLLQNTQLNPDSFLDCCLLIGFDLIPTFPGLLRMKPFSFQNAVDLVKQVGGYQAVKADEAFKNEFMRTKTLVLCHLVLYEDGTVAPLPNPYVVPPSDLHEVIGMRLPDILYVYMSRGWINPQVPLTLTSGTLTEAHPLCDGDLDEYQSFVSSHYLYNLRALALALLANSLNLFWREKHVTAVHWFQSHSPHPLPNAYMMQRKYFLSFWRSQKVFYGVGNKLSGSLSYLFDALSDPSKAELTFAQKTYNEYYEKHDVNLVVTSAICQVLELKGFIDSKTHVVSPIGEALMKGCSSFTDQNEKDRFLELTWFLLELFQTKYALKMESYLPSYDIGLDIADDDSKCKWFLCRLACLIFPKTTNIPWKGELSRDLLSFIAFVKNMKRSMRNVIEMSFLRYLTFMKYSGDTMTPVPKLPFVGDCCTISGVVMNYYLEARIKGKSKEVALKETIDHFKEWLVDTHKVLKDSFKLWNCMYETLVALPHPTGLEEDISEYISFAFMANDWVTKMKV